MELTHLSELEKATKKGRIQLFRLGIGLLFIIGVMLYTVVRFDATHGGSLFIVIAAMIGGYMAMNIGANDVVFTIKGMSID
jgi:PiT family inorganic phosphate transporter